jgi:energy-coupling factor transporter ATP-binding protein EcfA2
VTTPEPELLAITVGSTPLFRTMTLPLPQGLTVLYGVNGVGKTTLLRAVRKALVGQRRLAHAGQNAFWFLPDLFEGTGGIHLSAPFTGAPDDLAWFVPDGVRETRWRDASCHERFDFLLGQCKKLRTREPALKDASDEDLSTLLERGAFFALLGSPQELDPSDRAALIWLSAVEGAAASIDECFAKDVPVEVYLGEDEEGPRYEWPYNAFAGDRGQASLPGRQGLPGGCGAPILPLGMARAREGSVPGGTSHSHPAIPRPIVENDEVDLDVMTRDFLRVAVMNNLTPGAASEGDDDAWLDDIGGRLLVGGSHSKRLQWEAQHVEDAANETLSRLVLDPPRLRLEIRSPSSWFSELPLQWVAPDPLRRGRERAGRSEEERACEADLGLRAHEVGVDKLGWAHRRWSQYAIQLALGEATSPSHSVTLIDEPERALHASAEKALAHTLATWPGRVLVASHSVDFLDVDANLVHLTRLEDSGDLEARRLLIGRDHRTASEHLGIPLSRLMLLTRVVLCVEGPHDVAVLSELLADSLTAARAEVVPLGGTRRLNGAVDSRFLFDFTDAHVLVCVDNANPMRVKQTLEKLQGNPESATRVLGDTRKRAQTSEERALYELFEAAHQAGRLDRLHARPLTVRDVAYLLPVSLVARSAPRGSGWNELFRKYLQDLGRVRAVPGDGEGFKQWVNQKFSGEYTTVGLKKAARQHANQIAARSASPHPDIEALSALLFELSAR